MNTGTGTVIDIDQLETWPVASRHFIEQLLGTGPGIDMTRAVGVESAFRATLAQRPLLAYHCTRLTPHEVNDVRSRGLRMLDESLVRSRIADAAVRGLLAPDAHVRAERGNIYATSNTVGRTDQVCCVLGRSTFDDDAPGVSPLLVHWGGEAIRGGAGNVSELQSVGTPTIVAVRLDPSSDALWLPSLLTLFGKALRSSGRARGEVLYKAAVPAKAVLDLWQPGHPEYDRHADLPR